MQQATAFRFPADSPFEPDLSAASISPCQSIYTVSFSGMESSAYTVAHTISGRRTIHLYKHLARLFDSVQRLGYKNSWTPETIRRYVAACLEYLQLERSRFRITLPRDGSLVLTIEPHQGLSVEVRERGVTCVTAARAARSDSQTKTTDWIKAREAFRAPSAYETLLCDEGNYILEGASSNFFAVCRHPASPPASGTRFNSGRTDPFESAGSHAEPPVLRTVDKGILGGIARSIVLDLCRDFIQIDFSPVRSDELESIMEAFITSSTRGVVPVRSIDSRVMGPPGRVTRALMQRYDRWIEENAQPL